MHHRCLLLGRVPELEASGSLGLAVRSLLSKLASYGGRAGAPEPGPLGELVEQVLLGVTALSAAELHTATSQICRVASVPADEAQVAELASLFE